MYSILTRVCPYVPRMRVYANANAVRRVSPTCFFHWTCYFGCDRDYFHKKTADSHRPVLVYFILHLFIPSSDFFTFTSCVMFFFFLDCWLVIVSFVLIVFIHFSVLFFRSNASSCSISTCTTHTTRTQSQTLIIAMMYRSSALLHHSSSL